MVAGQRRRGLPPVSESSGQGTGWSLSVAVGSRGRPRRPGGWPRAISETREGKCDEISHCNRGPIRLADAERTFLAHFERWCATHTSSSFGANTDCYIVKSTANSSFCYGTSLRVGGVSANAMHRSLLRFNLKGVVPEAAVVMRSSLAMYFPAEPYAGRPPTIIRPKLITESWSPVTTWNKRDANNNWNTAGGDVSSDPELNGAPIAVMDSDKYYHFPLAVKAVQGWVSGEYPNYGVQLGIEPGTANFVPAAFGSSETTGSMLERPSLTVVWRPTMSEVIEDNISSITQAWALDTGVGDYGCDDICYFLRDSDHSAAPYRYVDAPTTAPNPRVYTPAEERIFTPRKTGSIAPPPNQAIKTAIKAERTSLQIAGRNALRFAARGAISLIPGPGWIMAGAQAGYLVYDITTSQGGTKRVVLGVPPAPGFYNWIPSEDALFPRSPGLPEPALPPGYVGQFHFPINTITTRGRSTHPDPNSPCNTPPAHGMPSGTLEFIWQENRFCQQEGDGASYAHGLYVSNLRMILNGFDMPIPAPSGTVANRGIQGPSYTQQEAEAIVRESLENGGLYLNQEISSQLGSGADPKYPSAAIPDCTGQTAAECDATLEEAGFLGKLTITTIPADQSSLEQEPGTVVETQPTGGTIENKHGDIEILVNAPEPPPTLRPRVPPIQDDLRAKNPQTRDLPHNPLTPPRAREIARRCVALTELAGIDPDQCRLRPILVIGSDAYQAALHDAQAIAQHPQWVRLNRRPAPPESSGFNLNWHLSTPPCADFVPFDGSRKFQCDEYPYSASFQGYFGSNTSPLPSTKMINATQNGREGNVLKQFYSKNLPGRPRPGRKPILFFGCGRQLRPNPAPSAPNVQAPTPVLDSDYLVIPMPFSKIESIGLCNSQPLPGHEAWN